MVSVGQCSRDLPDCSLVGGSMPMVKATDRRQRLPSAAVRPKSAVAAAKVSTSSQLFKESTQIKDMGVSKSLRLYGKKVFRLLQA